MRTLFHQRLEVCAVTIFYQTQEQRWKRLRRSQTSCFYFNVDKTEIVELTKWNLVIYHNQEHLK